MHRVDRGYSAVVNTATMPFCNQWERDTHFARHGASFGAVDAEEYEQMADTFAFGARAGDAQDCPRPGGDRVRFGFVTHLESVVKTLPRPECIRTFYAVRAATIARHGNEAGYFAFECARIHLVDL